MDDFNHDIIIKIEEDEDVKENGTKVIKAEPSHIEVSYNSCPTSHYHYQNSFDGQAGEIKIEEGETEKYYYKSIFEIEQQNKIDENEYKISESIIKVEDETDHKDYDVIKKDIMKEETFINKKKSTNIERSYNSCMTIQNDFVNKYDGNIYSYTEVSDTAIIKTEFDIVNGHSFKSVIEIKKNELLNVHPTNNYLDKIQQFSCDICMKSFNTKRKVAQHKTRSHSFHSSTQQKGTRKHINKKNLMVNGISFEENKKIDKPYTCAVCLRTLSHNSALTRHKRLHLQERPYKCTICPRSFIQNSDLTRHTRVHTKEKPYECDNCFKSFSLKSNLVKHRRGHTGERPYKCGACSKSFSLKSTLTKHERVHTGAKP